MSATSPLLLPLAAALAAVLSVMLVAGLMAAAASGSLSWPAAGAAPLQSPQDRWRAKAAGRMSAAAAALEAVPTEKQLLERLQAALKEQEVTPPPSGVQLHVLGPEDASKWLPEASLRAVPGILHGVLLLAWDCPYSRQQVALLLRWLKEDRLRPPLASDSAARQAPLHIWLVTAPTDPPVLAAAWLQWLDLPYSPRLPVPAWTWWMRTGAGVQRVGAAVPHIVSDPALWHVALVTPNLAPGALLDLAGLLI